MLHCSGSADFSPADADAGFHCGTDPEFAARRGWGLQGDAREVRQGQQMIRVGLGVDRERIQGLGNQLGAVWMGISVVCETACRGGG